MSKSLRIACVLVNLFVVLATASYRPAAATVAHDERAGREETVVSPENFRNGLQHTFSAIYQLIDNFQTIYGMVTKGPCDEGMKAYWTNIGWFLKDTLSTMIVSYRKSWSDITVPELGMKNFGLEFRDGSKLKTLRFERIVLRGLENVNVKTYNIDFCSMSSETEIVFPKLQLTAMYELDGYVNKRGPITGVGNLTVNIDALSIHSLTCGDSKSSSSYYADNISCNSMKTKPKSVQVNITGIKFMNLTDRELSEIINRTIAELLRERETQSKVTEQNAPVELSFKLPTSFHQYNARII